MKRRQFLKTTAIGGAMLAIDPSLDAFEIADKKDFENKLPRWIAKHC